MLTIDLTKGAVINFKGVFEETKTGTIHITGEGSADVDLTGAGVEFVAKKVNRVLDTAGMVSIVGGDIAYDFTAFEKTLVNYEIKVTQPDLVFKLRGVINFAS